ncbi:proline iminopeptidase-family hydrolase [Xanthocytophaga flava]|uniref:proline iminopeptidase-family hydrolase n=1 Tax=Xanthocytophaga flava TaxID=3048013 RepID=UPI0028D4922E|nr:proline iminopeptidase-family hydrolase [Xanthocytophaga flavus]MDJ1469241.1 proline iminopeptidase-family hydrolase [Xanthocytophaga flavus]
MKSFCLILTLQIFCLFVKAQIPKDSTYHAKISSPDVNMISVYKGKYKVFTQKVGTGSIKLLLLHGGPGQSHEYFENFPENLKNQNVTIYYYDQLGSYYSDNPDDSTVWNVNRFVEEIEEVRKGLKLDKFYLLGHSWGGMLAELYAAKYGQHLKGVILSNVPGFFSKDLSTLNSIIDSIDQTVRYRTTLLPKFSANKPQIDSISKGLALADQTISLKLTEQFNKANDSIFGKTMYYHKAGKMPEPLRRSMRHAENKGMDTYHFNPFGANYKQALEKNKVPTFLLGGQNDFLHPEYYDSLKKVMKNTKVKVYICPNGAHFPMWDDTDNYFRELNHFLKDVETGSFIPKS